jgi:cytochrome c-type biogenesis protein CcmE
MRHMRLKIAVAASVLILGVGFLAYAGMSSAQVYYLEVDPFLADAQFHGQRVRLCGTVGADNLVTDRAAMALQFELLGGEGKVVVAYHGIAPEMFRPGAAVVAEGKLDAAGVFHATQIMTKCASKYQPAAAPAKAGPPA